ncbi:hypothetical protein ISCGN_010929 [Ixodes scapularis]
MVSLQSPVRVATLNVRGLSDRRRQRQLCRLAVEQDLDIIAVQETKVESEDQTNFMDGLKAEIKDGIVYSPYPETEIPMCSLYAVVEQKLLRFGDKAALVQHADSLTYLEMLSLLRRYSAGFQARGIGRGDRVTCCLSNTLENFVALFGVIFAGATTILTEPVLTSGESCFFRAPTP